MNQIEDLVSALRSGTLDPKNLLNRMEELDVSDINPINDSSYRISQIKESTLTASQLNGGNSTGNSCGGGMGFSSGFNPYSSQHLNISSLKQRTSINNLSNVKSLERIDERNRVYSDQSLKSTSTQHILSQVDSPQIMESKMIHRQESISVFSDEIDYPYVSVVNKPKSSFIQNLDIKITNTSETPNLQLNQNQQQQDMRDRDRDSLSFSITQREEEELKQCTFKPQLCPNSLKMAQNNEKIESKADKIARLKILRQQNLKAIQEYREQMQFQENCTFKPQICENSSIIMQNRILKMQQTESFDSYYPAHCTNDCKEDTISHKPTVNEIKPQHISQELNRYLNRDVVERLTSPANELQKYVRNSSTNKNTDSSNKVLNILMNSSSNQGNTFKNQIQQNDKSSKESFKTVVDQSKNLSFSELKTFWLLLPIRSTAQNSLRQDNELEQQDSTPIKYPNYLGQTNNQSQNLKTFQTESQERDIQTLQASNNHRHNRESFSQGKIHQTAEEYTEYCKRRTTVKKAGFIMKNSIKPQSRESRDSQQVSKINVNISNQDHQGQKFMSEMNFDQRQKALLQQKQAKQQQQQQVLQAKSSATFNQNNQRPSLMKSKQNSLTSFNERLEQDNQKRQVKQVQLKQQAKYSFHPQITEKAKQLEDKQEIERRVKQKAQQKQQQYRIMQQNKENQEASMSQSNYSQHGVKSEHQSSRSSMIALYQHVEPKLKKDNMQECVKQIQENLKTKYMRIKEKQDKMREIKELEECTHQPKINK
ncbi:UNKNOWN [Stylonychia lemnae]|uniref:Uncharacterized protein n=1 Tax=Stylonychia lemnae TaxID=5949 RepID=A0A078AKR3_STYLE|nr:UNKNOWN [Stylonychia lemnae]|eukprot:CDW82042.1 UNKNOWN [Stylonychia lemnae]